MDPENEEPTDGIQEGDREPGEIVPIDDSHITGSQDSPTEEPVTPEPDPTAELVSVNINGQSFEVTPEVALAIQTQQAPTPAPAPTPASPIGSGEAEDFETLIFSNPKAAKELIKKEVFAEVSEAYANDQQTRDFWTQFYVENPDLQEHDWIVRSILERDMNRFQNLKGKTGRDAVADTVKKDILSLSNKSQKTSNTRKVDTTLEGSSSIDSPTPELEDSELAHTRPNANTFGLGNELRERAKRRRRSRSGETALS